MKRHFNHVIMVHAQQYSIRQTQVIINGNYPLKVAHPLFHLPYYRLRLAQMHSGSVQRFARIIVVGPPAALQPTITTTPQQLLRYDVRQ